jgi:cell division protein FtsX
VKGVSRADHRRAFRQLMRSRPHRRIPLTSTLANAGRFVRDSWLGLIAITLIAAAALALGTVGSGVHRSLDSAETAWKRETSARVFLRAEANQDDIDRVGSALRASPAVTSISFVDHDGALREFNELTDDPNVRSAVVATDLPTSWRIEFEDIAATDTVRSLLDRVSLDPATIRVIDPTRSVDRIRDVGSGLRAAAMIGAVIGVVLWMVLTALTVRSALQTRAADFGVMRLVGAPRLLITTPVLIVAAVTGLAAGIGAVYLSRFGADVATSWAQARPTWSALVLNDDVRIGVSEVTTWLPLVGAVAAVAVTALCVQSLVPRR